MSDSINNVNSDNFQTKILKAVTLERNAIEFVDHLLSSYEFASCAISEIFQRLNYLPAPTELREYIGYDVSDVSEFLHVRNHLWRVQDEGIRKLPGAFRAAILELVASIVLNNNRASLGDIFIFLRKNHGEALPFLPSSPSNGSSLEAVRNFILGFPGLFRLVNAADGNEWTRMTPLSQIAVECVSSAVDGVILLDVSPASILASQQMPSSRSASGPQHQPGPPAAPVTANGVGEVVRLTPAWGYLQSDVHGPIFFTSGACGNQNLLSTGIKLGSRLAFEANYCDSNVQVYNNVQVKWRATKVRTLTAVERDAIENGLPIFRSAASTSSNSVSSASLDSHLGQSPPVQLASIQLPSTAPRPVSNPMQTAPVANPPIDAATSKRLPTSLAEWVKQRQAAAKRNQTASPREVSSPPRHPTANEPSSTFNQSIPSKSQLSTSPAGNQQQNRAASLTVGELSSALQAIEDELECEIDPQFQYGRSMNHAATHESMLNQYSGGQQQHSASSNKAVRASPLANGAAFAPVEAHYATQNRDVAVQTDVTDEEMLLRILRTAPELLDLVRLNIRE